MIAMDAAPETGPRFRSKPLVLASASLGTFLVILLTSGLNIMSPSIRTELHATEGALSWVLSGYTLAFAMLSLTGGALSDRFGAHRVFMTGLVVFAVFSTVAAAAPSVGFVIVGTFGEGAGAALVLPAALALIQFVFGDNTKKLGVAIGVWAGANALGAAVGPVVCGALVSSSSWRVAFVVVAVLAVVFAAVGLPVFPRIPTSDRPIDLPGLMVMVVLLGVIVFIAHDAIAMPPLMIVAGVFITVLLIWAFAAIERRASAPMLPLEQLRDIAFSGNALVTIVGTAAFFGPLYIVSMGLQDQLGMSAFASGVALLPLAGGNVIAALAAGRLQERIGIRGTMLTGSALIVISLIPIPFLFERYDAIIPALIVLGVGWGLLVPSTSAAGLVRAQPGKEGVASGVTAGGRELGAALAAAVLLPMGVTGGLLVSAVVGVGAIVIVLLTVRRLNAPIAGPANEEDGDRD